MSSINSWCGRFCISSLILLLSIFIIDCRANLIPLKGIWLALYMFLIIISTVWVSCVFIQRLLQHNQVFEFDFEANWYLKFIRNSCKVLRVPIDIDFLNTKKIAYKNGSNTPTEPKILTKFLESIPILKDKATCEVRGIDERIELFTDDIEERFISKWYKHISKDDTFPAESKILLEGVVRRILQVSVHVDADKILCGMLVIVLKHLKEYRKAVKRASKNGSSIESVYRYSHLGNKSHAALEQYTHRLTGNVLREFINWELWNSLPSRLLVSILSKRLTTYIINHISQPGWINYKLISYFASEKTITNLNLTRYSYISLLDINLSGTPQNGVKSEVSDQRSEVKSSMEGSTPKMSPKKELSLPKLAEDVSKIDSVVQGGSESMIEKALTKMLAQHTAPILQRAEKNVEEKGKELRTPTVSNKSTPEHKKAENFKPKRSEPVKIHSAQSTMKRWDDSDVGNISIGQDLLALEGMESSDLQGFSGRRLWGPSLGNEHDMDKHSHPLWDISEIFKDKEGMDDEKIKEESKMSPKVKEKKIKDVKVSPPVVQTIKTSTTNAASIITNTIKPIGNVTATTLHNMRELQQSTVNNVVKPVSNATEKAIHKIGDLQHTTQQMPSVNTNAGLVTTRKVEKDEAVGVVEGIFDFGMAGIRKGLRLTGLQDNTSEIQQKPKTNLSTQLHHQENIKQSPKNVPKLVKVGHITSEDIKKSSQDSVENVWINPLAKESPNGFENQMLFEKSPNLDQENMSEIAAPVVDISAEDTNFLNESPEYEETADLASTISKLRSLLQQKSSESSLNTPAASPMPGDDKPCATPTEPAMNDARNDGGMQRFARTVTGMFNTFKGALPGNIGEQTQAKSDQWIYIENEVSETDLPSLLNSLLIERRDYCTVDTAYEAMDSLDLLTESATSPIKKIQWENQTFEDELDEFDGSIPITEALLDVLCECLLDTGCALKQEPVLKAFLVVAGRKLENILSLYAEKTLRLFNKAIGPLPKSDNDLPMAMELDKMVRALEDGFPDSMKKLFGEEDLRTGLRFFISSLQNMTINQDIVLQLSELICSQLIYASSQMSPTPSA